MATFALLKKGMIRKDLIQFNNMPLLASVFVFSTFLKKRIHFEKSMFFLPIQFEQNTKLVSYKQLPQTPLESFVI